MVVMLHEPSSAQHAPVVAPAVARSRRALITAPLPRCSSMVTLRPATFWIDRMSWRRDRSCWRSALHLNGPLNRGVFMPYTTWPKSTKVAKSDFGFFIVSLVSLGLLRVGVHGHGVQSLALMVCPFPGLSVIVTFLPAIACSVRTASRTVLSHARSAFQLHFFGGSGMSI